MKLENPLQIKPFKTRRSRLGRSLGDGVVVVPTAPEVHRNADTHYDYRWDSGFYYLTGFTEPEAREYSARDWHAQGLAIRPGHNTSGHTGFLITARKMAPGVAAPARRRRPAPGTKGRPASGG